MTLEDSLKLERYKLVTSRQAWVMDVARGVYVGYATTIAAFVGGALTLVLTSKQTSALDSEFVGQVLFMIAVFITCVALVSTFQIGFCTWRSYEYRVAECKLFPDAPQPVSWAKYFELAFVALMAASVALVWVGYSALSRIV